ncbi:MAG: beta-ketoacyl-[acyl-carrier-protein] synthase family protein [Paludibacteraceae bacterium]|nr:beta-ketoacyl-[acyl-carrier-protein] synthase family protein [Paludibacteraceae bacterium]
MRRRVFVTGFGILSAIGCDVESNYSSLLSGRSGIGQAKFVKTLLDRYPFAEVPASNEELAAKAGLRLEPFHSRTFLLGLCAAKEAIRMAGCEDQLPSMALVGSTTVAGMDLTESCYVRMVEEDPTLKYLVDSMDCSDAVNRMASVLGNRNMVSSVSTACSSSANAIIVGTRMISSGLADRALVGGMDSLVRFSINGFNALEILSPTGSQPFDQNRDGVTPSEGAAFLVLEAEDVVGNRRVYGEIKGFANANAAFHQTASSPNGEGALAVISKAIEKAGLQPSEIDYVNAHGTGTKNNDLSEGRALEAAFGVEAMPLFSSTKGYTGHPFAAAGAVEAVFSLLAINNQVVFPNINFKTPMEELSIRPVTTLQKKEIRNVLSNSFGFGGADSSLIISKV